MLVEKNLREVLEYYIKGKPVTALWIGEDGSMKAMPLSDILDQPENHFLVDVPAVANPDFEQAVQDMTEVDRADPDAIIQAVHENQEEKCQFGKWIPISERLPGAGEYILVSFANEGFSLPDIAVYEVDSYGNGVFYPADRTVPYSLIGVFVNAWMPLPEPYKQNDEGVEK